MARKILKRSRSPLFRNILILLSESIVGITIFQAIRTIIAPSFFDFGLLLIVGTISVIVSRRP